MNEIGKFSAKLIFYFVAAVLLLWTASLTVAFVSAALPGMPWYIPYLSLVIFDGGMIAWLYVFLKHAQGTIQRATALIATGLNFLGVGLMVLAEVLLGGQQLTAAPQGLGTAAIWGIGIWTVINVAAVLLFHIGDPEAQKAMSIQNEKDAIWRGALAELAARRKTHSAMLTAELGDRLYRDLLDDLLVDADGNGVPDIFEAQQPRSLPAPPADGNLKPRKQFGLWRNGHIISESDNIDDLRDNPAYMSGSYIVDRNGDIVPNPELASAQSENGSTTAAGRRANFE